MAGDNDPSDVEADVAAIEEAAIAEEIEKLPKNSAAPTPNVDQGVVEPMEAA
ncbi:hypothetical protein [Bosea sp. NPDC055594]